MRGWRCIKVGYKHDEAASQTILEEILHFPLYVLLTSFFSEETITGPPRRQQRIKPKVLSLYVSYPMDWLWQFLVWSWQRTCKNSVHRMSSHRTNDAGPQKTGLGLAYLGQYSLGAYNVLDALTGVLEGRLTNDDLCY